MAEEYVHPELQNLAKTLDDSEIIALGHEAAEAYNHDLDDLQAWRTMHAGWVSQYYQQDKPENPPWEGASEESVPILAEACNQFHSRAYLSMFANPELVTAIPTGQPTDDDIERAERVSLHMTWQLSVKDPRYKKNKDRLLLGLPVHGSYFTKAGYDNYRKANTVRNVRPTDLIVPYGTGPREIEDLERKTEKIWLPLFQGQNLASLGFFTHEPTAYQRGDKSEVDEAHEQAQGSQQTRPQDGPSLVLEQHCMLDLDDDGLPEPYIVWIDAQNQQLLRVSIRWLTDPAGNAIDEQGRPLNARTVAGPSYSGPSIRPKTPIEYYTHYAFLENPDGFLGLGLGHLLGPPNRAVNKMLRQTIDAGTLANAGNMSGFISDQLAVAGGELDVVMGKFKKVSMSGEEIRNSIVQLTFPGPNQAMHDVLQLIMQRADRLGTATEAVTGQLDRALQPTTLLSLLEESGRIFSAVNERTVECWKSELAKLYRLNATHMDPVEYYAVLDADGSIAQREVHRSDYAPDLQILPTVDPRMTTRRQKIAQAEAEWNFLSTNPLVMQSPEHFYNASKRFLRAIGAERIEEVLPAPSPIELLVASLRVLGFDDQEIEQIVEQIGLAAMVATAGDGGGVASLGQPLQGRPMEDGQVQGGAQTLTGAERGNGSAAGS